MKDFLRSMFEMEPDIASNPTEVPPTEYPTAEVVVTPAGVPLTVAKGPDDSTLGMVVLHEIWGLTEPVINLVTRLARDRHVVVAPHMYHRTGSAVVEDDTYRSAKRKHNSLTVHCLRSDLESAVAWCRANGAETVTVIGFSMGGTIALWAAAEFEIDAAVTFYGGGIRAERWPGVLSGLDAARGLKAPWLGIYGGRDRSTPTQDLDELREALTTAVRSKLVVYPEAKHGFALDPESSNYSADRAREAFDVMTDFLGEPRL